MKNKKLIAVVFGAIASVSSVHSTAALLVNGDTIALSGTTTAMQPELAALVENDNILYESISPSMNPLFQVGVDVQNRAARSFLTDNIIMMPRIRPVLNNTSGNFLIDKVVMSGFTDFVLDVDYRTDGLGDRGPNSVTRSVDGDQLSFDFLFPLNVPNLAPNPIEQSYFFSILTNTNAYSNTGTMSIFGRHLDYPGETFEFFYTGIAVPAPQRVSAPGVAFMFLLFFGYIVSSQIQARNRRISVQ